MSLRFSYSQLHLFNFKKDDIFHASDLLFSVSYSIGLAITAEVEVDPEKLQSPVFTLFFLLVSENLIFNSLSQRIDESANGTHFLLY